MDKWRQEDIDRFIVEFREMYNETTDKHREYLEGLETKEERVEEQRALRKDYIDRVYKD